MNYDYDDIINSNLTKEQKLQAIKERGLQNEREINKQSLKDYARIGLGSLLSGASFHPVFNIPYVGTGLGGAMYDAGQGIVEGDKLGDVAKRAGRGFVIGETVGTIPYVGKAASKTKTGQTVANQVGRVAKKIADTPAVQKIEDVLMTDIKAFNPNKQTVFHGSPYDFGKFSNEAIGTGEGAQAHGLGHYTALNKDVAEGYRNKLSTTTADETLIKQFGKERVINDLQNNLNDSLQELQALQKSKIDQDKIKDLGRRKPIDYDYSIKIVEDEIKNLQNRIYNINNPQVSGQLYKLSVPKDDVMLREGATFSEQPKKVQRAINKKLYDEIGTMPLDDAELENLYNLYIHNPEDLAKYGVKGISYNGGIDGEARVIFNPDDIDIVRKYYNQPSLADMLQGKTNSGSLADYLTNKRNTRF